MLVYDRVFNGFQQLCDAAVMAGPPVADADGLRSARFLHVSEDEEPDWLAELAKGGEALRRQMESVVQAAEQFAASSPARPLARQIRRAVDAALRELTSSPEPVTHHVTAHAGLATASAVALAPTITAVGSIALPKMRVSGQGTVQNRVRGQAERDIGYILALMLVAFVTGGLLGVAESDRAAVDHYLAVIGVMLPIAVFIYGRWNKPK